MQHGSFDNLRLLGFFAGLTFEKALPSSPDSFGYEATTDWLAFNHVSCKTSTQDGQWCVWFKQGSGTGNTFTDMRTTITGAGTGSPTPAAAIRFDGPTHSVVGDQVVTDSQFGGVHAVFSVAAGTAYRSNMSVTGSQLDAGVSNFADLPIDAPVFARLFFLGNNVGGSVALSYPPVAASIIDDQLVDERRAGTGSLRLSNSPSSATTRLFSATTGSKTNTNFYMAPPSAISQSTASSAASLEVARGILSAPLQPQWIHDACPRSSEANYVVDKLLHNSCCGSSRNCYVLRHLYGREWWYY